MTNRRLSQLISLVLLHSSWGPELKWFCNPVLSCHSCVLAWFACPVGVFVHYSGYHTFPFFAAGMVMLFGVLVGRLLCGWVCPFGFLMDMLYRIPSPKFTLPAWTSYIKYAVLVATVFVTPFLFGESTDYSFCKWCPASAIQITVPNLVQGGFDGATWWTAGKLGVLAGVLALGVFTGRAFCNVLCPIGAMLALFNYISFWSVKPPETIPCLGCGKCDKACPTHAQPSARIEAGVSANRSAECIVCHDCQDLCPPAREGPA